MGMCPSTNALPPTGPLPVEPRQEELDSSWCPSHIAHCPSSKRQALSPQAIVHEEQTFLYLAMNVRRLTVEGAMKGVVHDHWVSMGDPGSSSLNTILQSPTPAARTEILWLIDFSRVAGPGEATVIILHPRPRQRYMPAIIGGSSYTGV